MIGRYSRGVAQFGLAHLLWEQGVGGSNPLTPTIRAGIAQLARASAFQAEGRGFESRFPLHFLFRFSPFFIHYK
jgi:hypothetical protein